MDREEVITISPIENLHKNLEAIDNLLISKFEKFCHFTQKSIGLTSKHWGRICVIFGGCDLSFRTAFPRSGEVHSAWRWVPFGVIVFLLLRMYYEFGKKNPKIGEVVTANIYRYAWQFVRRIQIPFIPWTVYYTIFKEHRPTFGIALLFALYLLAVDDLPSQPSKLRLWLESLTPDPLPNEGSARNRNV